MQQQQHQQQQQKEVKLLCCVRYLCATVGQITGVLYSCQPMKLQEQHTTTKRTKLKALLWKNVVRGGG